MDIHHEGDLEQTYCICSQISYGDMIAVSFRFPILFFFRWSEFVYKYSPLVKILSVITMTVPLSGSITAVLD